MRYERSASPSATDELAPLVQGYCDDTLSEANTLRLEQLLSGDEARQRFFLAHVDLHARLRWEAGHGCSTSHEIPQLPRSAVNRPTFSKLIATAAAIALLAMATIAILRLNGHDTMRSRVASGPSTSAPITPTTTSDTVTVLNAAGLWNEQANFVRAGKVLRRGVVDLPQGIIELGYDSGVRLLLESPAKLELIDGERAFLHSGRLTARVPHTAIGFVVETSRARIKDLGTEFGVEVRSEGATQIQVYEGKVDAGIKDADGQERGIDQLTSGQALAFASVKEQLSFAPHRFLRSFPVAPDADRPVTLACHPQTQTVHIGRFTKPPRIDGDLSEWDHGRAFTSRCLDPNGDRYFVEGMIACDDRHLYVAAHVGDPAPMASMIDYAQEPDYFWTGGAVVLRLAANNSFGWPLDAVRPRDPNATRAPSTDFSDQIVHVGMWYSKRLARAQLVLQYGMDCHGQILSQAGWEGAFHADADGRGYTMEYAIDHSLLHAAPPRPGDTWPANWTVHWSDADGRTCMGELTEIVNLREQSFNAFRAHSWGKIVFEDR